MVKVLCFDSSTKCTGWAYFVDGQYIRSGVLDLSNEKDVVVRMDKMLNVIHSTLKAVAPDIVYVEIPKQGNNPDSLRKLSMIIGAIWGYCYEHNIYYEEFAPSVWRKYADTNKEITSKKRDDLKKWSIAQVKKIYNIETEYDDEADAIMIIHGAINKYKD